MHFRNIDSRMTDDAKAARNAYARAWRERNRDKVRRYNEAYWQRKAEKKKAAEGSVQ